MLKRIEVQVGSHYQVVIGARAIEELPSDLGRLFVVVDSEVERLHGQKIRSAWAKHSCEWLVLPGGEGCKTLAQAESLYNWLATHHVERSEHLVALGGGAVGDLVGWVAASWKRGIPFIQVPTTLLAQVDSSVGGKVAVNHPSGKNLIGAFHQPRLVLADTSLLSTLPYRQLNSGLAEVAKTALLAGEPLFAQVEAFLMRWKRTPSAAKESLIPPDPQPPSALLSSLNSDLSEIIAQCVNYKAEIVRRDPFENGERAILNLGHTLGHALETWSTRSARSAGILAHSGAAGSNAMDSGSMALESADLKSADSGSIDLESVDSGSRDLESVDLKSAGSESMALESAELESLEIGSRGVDASGVSSENFEVAARSPAELFHGEAVIWGLKAALLLSGFSKDSREYRLVSTVPVPPLAPLSFDALLEAMRSDKKAQGGTLKWVLLKAAGKPRWGCELSVEQVRAAWEAL